MKLTAFADRGTEILAVVDGEDLFEVSTVDAFYADTTKGLAAAAAALSARQGARQIGSVTIVAPVPRSAKVLCAALNYPSHANESAHDPSEKPDLFARWYSTLTADNVPVPMPPRDERFDWEGELAVIIGSPVNDIEQSAARAAFLGYSILNDLSARGLQQATRQYAVGKNADRSAPFGPVIVTADEIEDPYDCLIETRVNGEVVQSAKAGEMTFKAEEIVAYASGSMTLVPGDVISTGTPAGVGLHRTPPRFLKAGDTVEVQISKIGTLTTPIVAHL